MPKVGCYCTKCGVAYIEEDTSLVLPPGMMPVDKPPKRPYLLTWPEWIYHVATHCTKCRYAAPPRDCILHLNKYTDAKRSNSLEISEMNAMDQLNDHIDNLDIDRASRIRKRVRYLN